MGKPTGFLEYVRKDPPKRPVAERVRDWREVEHPLADADLREQAARCMDCGVPFCHALGCPLGARLPDVNDLVYRGQWERALDLLHAANNFPEITGRVCPAVCEAACTLSINAAPVASRHIERQVAEHGWRQGWIRPQPPRARSGRRVAVVGSGPAGLAAAQQLARRGHEVVVFERADRVGGILRYGIPDFKLEKWVIDRRLEQMRAEGVAFETGTDAGTDLSGRYLRRTFDAVCLAVGAAAPRDLTIPGRGYEGIHFAMDYLVQQNRAGAGDALDPEQRISARDKDVVVIGGGDTGADCVGTARRQGARSITQIELLPEPPAERAPDNPWPTWPAILRTSTSHEEGCRRLWSVLTKEFLGRDVRVRGLHGVRIEWSEPDAAGLRPGEAGLRPGGAGLRPGEAGRRTFREVPGSDFELAADLVLLALGFLHVEHGPLVEALGLGLDERGNVRVDADARTAAPGVFAAGDAVRGASLVVHAIGQGRRMAEGVDRYLRTGPERAR